MTEMTVKTKASRTILTILTFLSFFASGCKQPNVRAIQLEKLKEIANAIQMHESAYGHLPKDINDAKKFLHLGEEQLHDAWKTKIYYEHQGQGFKVISAGVDREFFTDDDLIISVNIEKNLEK